MGYIGAGLTRFNTADELTVTGDAEFDGNLTVKGTHITLDSATVQTVDLGDNDKIRLGDGDDLEIYHNGTENVIDSNSGTLVLRSAGAGTIELRDQGSQVLAQFNDNADAKLYYNNNLKIATTATGVDVTGAISANKGSAGVLATFTDGVNSNFVVETASLLTTIGNGGGSAALALKANNTEAIRITSSGFVGIGTNSPSRLLSLNSSNASIDFSNGTWKNEIINSSGQMEFRADHTNSAGASLMSFSVDGSERMRIDSSGNVGIGTSSMVRRLEITDGTSGKIRAKGTDGGFIECHNGTNGVYFGTAPAVLGSGGGGDSVIFTDSGFNQLYYTSGAERMRIDSSGNLLVGKTAGSNTTKGSTLTQTGEIVSTITTAGGASQNIFLNRQDAYGTCILMRYANASVGHIGLFTGNLVYLGAGNSGLKFGADIISPSRADNGNDRDNVIDLGKSASRFDNIYATNATIQTSDANEKQQIAALTDVEMTAAKAISQLFKTYKWNSAVEIKGDAARTHTGVIAQDVQAAMIAAGLDAGDYAFFISSTWWETQTEVPAVEAVEAVDAVYEDVVIPAVEEELDEDGNVIVEAQAERTEQRLVSEAVEAVEAVAAYTRTDTYDTAEEAPEGATERTRMGIRYPELLSFIGAATEQRLSNIETRLAALETA